MEKKFVFLVSLLIFFAFFYSDALCQQHTVKGWVKDESGGPVIGANVVVKNSSSGVTTDANGHFILNKVNIGDTIVFSYIAYITQRLVYHGQNEITMKFEKDNKLLDEVVVIGYGQVRKGDATGALTSIKVDDKVRGFAPNAQDLLVGKVAGVTITGEGGSPQGSDYIRIRGGSSLSASNDPLIIVDGVFIDNQGLNGAGNTLSTINPTDIASFTVLKDASATAIYGSRASNGVIIITTKKGTKGRIKITYDGNISIGTCKKEIAVLTGNEYRVFLKDVFSNLSIYNKMKEKTGLVNTDWQNEIFRTTFNSEHNLSLYGTSGNWLPYRISLGYTDINGILKTSNTERYTGSFSLTPSFFNNYLKINLNGRGMYVHNRFANWDAIGAAIAMDPSQSVYEKNSPYGGYFTWTGDDGNIIQVATTNPLSMLEMTKDQSKVKNFIGNTEIDYKLHFFPDMHLNVNFGMDYANSNGIKYISEFAPSDYMYGGYDSNWNEKVRNSSLEIYSQYAKDFNFLWSHFDIMGGYSWQHYWRSDNSIGHRITQFDEYGNPVLVTEGHSKTEHYIISFFGRMNYNIKDKYLFTFTLRKDGSSRFSKEHRWSLFPSAALAWRISEENFIKRKNAISNLKLRLSWGKTGQQDINQGDYPYMSTYLYAVGDQANYLRGYNSESAIWTTLLRPQAYNPYLKWETTTTYNVGLDYGFFKDRLDGSFELYYRKTINLINANTRTTAGTNFSEYVVANIGSLSNTGCEFSLTGRPVFTKDLTWEIGSNLSYNKNKITKLTLGDNKNTKNVNGITANMVGYAANMFYVYQQIYDSKGKPIEGLYKDQNNDGKINEQDLRPYKNPTPDFTMGFNTKLAWKAWDISISGHGSLGNYVYNEIAATHAGLSPTSIYANEFLTNRVKSAFDTNFQVNEPFSDYYVQNASFFRIDNIILGWSFKKSKQIPFDGRIYSCVQNSFVFTKYKGIDPEVFGGNDGNLYPRPLTFLLGANLNF